MEIPPEVQTEVNTIVDRHYGKIVDLTSGNDALAVTHVRKMLTATTKAADRLNKDGKYDSNLPFIYAHALRQTLRDRIAAMPKSYNPIKKLAVRDMIAGELLEHPLTVTNGDRVAGPLNRAVNLAFGPKSDGRARIDNPYRFVGHVYNATVDLLRAYSEAERVKIDPVKLADVTLYDALANTLLPAHGQAKLMRRIKQELPE